MCPSSRRSSESCSRRTTSTSACGLPSLRASFSSPSSQPRRIAMAWSWSHTPEAYENARLNLLDLDLDTLRVTWAEWMACPPADDGFRYDEDFVLDDYEAALDRSASFDAETLAESIWDFAAEQQTCTNGGWEAWICPSGCHTVPFSRGDDDEQ